MITVGSLFSGIGGIEYGLEQTGGFKTIWQCEIDAYASAVLRKHWSNIPNMGDITKIEWGGVEKPNLICGGFPCQDISIAGKGKGILEGARSKLWSEFARCLREIRPRYALVENVPELANRGLWLVLADLAKMGYDAEWGIVPAAAMGAPHKRERLFIIAHLNDDGCDRSKEQKGQLQTDFKWNMEAVVEERLRCQFASEPSNPHECLALLPLRGYWSAFPPLLRVADGLPNRTHRIKCLGNAVVPQVAQVVGEMILEMEKAVVIPASQEYNPTNPSGLRKEARE